MSYYRQGPVGRGGGSVTIGIPPVTPMLKAILIANFAVFLLQKMSGTVLLDWFALAPSDVLSGQVWQVATYMLLHSTDGFGHIFFNMLALWMFGGDLERAWGAAGFLRYYLICGIGAGLFILVQGALGANPSIPTLGASGALYGVIMAYGLLFSERRVLFMMIFPMKAKTFALLFFFLAVYSNFGAGPSGTSHIAHLGGALTGLIVLKRLWRIDRFYKEMRWRIQRRRFKVMMGEGDDKDRWIH